MHKQTDGQTDGGSGKTSCKLRTLAPIQILSSVRVHLNPDLSPLPQANHWPPATLLEASGIWPESRVNHSQHRLTQELLCLSVPGIVQAAPGPLLWLS